MLTNFETPKLKKSHKKSKIANLVVQEVENQKMAQPASSPEKPVVNQVEMLVAQHMSYAAAVATKMARSLSSDIDIDEVICNARLGLLEAAQRYDSKFGVDFKTFAYYRIKGAVYDGLRKTGWIPRSIYSKIKFEQAANDYLQNNPGLTDAKTEFLRKEVESLRDTVNSVASMYVMSIDSLDDFEIEDDQTPKDMEHRAEFQKIKGRVCDAIEGLPDKERKLIKMYYFQNKTMEEIGALLNLSKSWTSRLHARGLELLYKKVMTFGQQSVA